MHAALDGATGTFQAHGSAPVLALRQHRELIRNMVVRQAVLLAYIDDFKVLGLSALCVVPLALLLKGG